VLWSHRPRRSAWIEAASRSWLQLHVRRLQDEIECLGIEASPSFVREPEGNGVAERFIRTLKENLLWVRTFDTIEEPRAALIEFARHYNETWLVARHGYRTPSQVRAEFDEGAVTRRFSSLSRNIRVDR
jgi:transposase InsO family protein